MLYKFRSSSCDAAGAKCFQLRWRMASTENFCARNLFSVTTIWCSTWNTVNAIALDGIFRRLSVSFLQFKFRFCFANFLPILFNFASQLFPNIHQSNGGQLDNLPNEHVTVDNKIENGAFFCLIWIVGRELICLIYLIYTGFQVITRPKGCCSFPE